MNDGRHFLLEKKIRDLKIYLGIMLRNYPRYEKFALAQEIRLNIVAMQKLVLCTGKKYFKKTDLRDLDIRLKRYITSACTLELHHMFVNIIQKDDLALLARWCAIINFCSV